MKVAHVQHAKWRTPNLSELTPIMFDMELTHLGLEVAIYSITISYYLDNTNLNPNNTFF